MSNKQKKKPQQTNWLGECFKLLEKWDKLSNSDREKAIIYSNIANKAQLEIISQQLIVLMQRAGIQIVTGKPDVVVPKIITPDFNPHKSA